MRVKSGFRNCFSVAANRRLGGLALLWVEDLDLIIKSYSLSHIDSVIKLIGRNSYWRLTGVYGGPETQLRHETWSLLYSLSNQCDLPWLCMGDFNEIISMAEREGGRYITEFRETLDACRLRDPGFHGCPYTWSNGREGENRIRSRLDRGASTVVWLSIFPTAVVTHQVSGVSDHCPILISLYDHVNQIKNQEELQDLKLCGLNKRDVKILSEKLGAKKGAIGEH
ncbi:Exo_endo_phos domain-containing protein [Cephalotus follicularis]|uniref:Exo_endo_phos domain-containing protein n=1 Tax=Cephalotus follicularis TaxID=3775 RepID=A0A1Q3BZB3_CEPFO|nr:Exo_endo_phos domain-containing protein [Cephalotus follicularis]